MIMPTLHTVSENNIGAPEMQNNIVKVNLDFSNFYIALDLFIFIFEISSFP